MARTLPTGVSAVISAESYRAIHAVEILFSTPVRVVEPGVGDVVISGNTFVESFSGFGDMQLQGISQISIVMPNTANEISQYDSDRVMSVLVNVYEVFWNASDVILNPHPIAKGHISSLSYGDKTANVDCRVEPGNGSSFIGRIGRRLCGYTFKGTRCGYAGINASCARTRNACIANSNSSRYGGFDLMPVEGQVFQYISRGSSMPSEKVYTPHIVVTVNGDTDIGGDSKVAVDPVREEFPRVIVRPVTPLPPGIPRGGGRR